MDPQSSLLLKISGPLKIREQNDILSQTVPHLRDIPNLEGCSKPVYSLIFQSNF